MSAYTVRQVAAALTAVLDIEGEAENLPEALREVLRAIDISPAAERLLRVHPAAVVADSMFLTGVSAGWQARQRLLDVEALEALEALGGG